jgi:hypothetical protein
MKANEIINNLAKDKHRVGKLLKERQDMGLSVSYHLPDFKTSDGNWLNKGGYSFAQLSPKSNTLSNLSFISL